MKGGSLNFVKTPVENSDFKYTINPERMLWVKNVFPIRDILVNIIQSMKWKSFHFDGIIPMWRGDEIEQNEVNANPEMKYTKGVGRIVATTKNQLPFSFFGGSVYEILHNSYNGVGFPNLHTFVDPTGDLDINVSLPEIVSFETDLDEPMPYFFEDKEGTTLNALLQNYIEWYYQEFKKSLSYYVKYFDYLFPNSIPFDYKTNAEGASAVHAEQFGNLWLLKIPEIERGMYKIQLLAQFDGMKSSDHMIELVFSSNPYIVYYAGDFLRPKPSFKKDEVYTTPLGLYIDSFEQLYSGNENSLMNRITLWNTDMRHKFYNHVGRIQYLNLLMQKLFSLPKDKPYLTKVTVSIQKLLKLLVEHKQARLLCQYDFNFELTGVCNEKEIAQSLVSNFKNLFFEQKFGLPFFILGQRFLKVNSQQRDYNWVLNYLLETPSVGGKSRRRKANRRRRTQRRSKIKLRK